MAYDFNSIVSNFKLQGNITSCERYGEGHINETYLLVLENQGEKTQYILQKIASKNKQNFSQNFFDIWVAKSEFLWYNMNNTKIF